MPIFYDDTQKHERRIYIHRDTVVPDEISERIKRLSMWGGPDKFTGIAYGYEFTIRNYIKCLSFLMHNGFKLSPDISMVCP